MMAQPVPHPTKEKRRVKVYELRNNDWYDHGTGLVTALFTSTEEGPKDARLLVESEEPPIRLLLDSRIQKQDEFQKQQETLIVWQEPVTGIDMALSFQEPEGCLSIWRFINSVQQAMEHSPPPVTEADTSCVDDGASDDLAVEVPTAVSLPPAEADLSPADAGLPPVELGKLAEVDTSMRVMAATANGRDALAKSIMAQGYIEKLIPLVEMAEDLESLPDLHRLCNIMKTILLLNDGGIIEHAVSDECVLGVVGALEYDPDFPSHKANHRHWLDNQGRYKEVVPIKDELTRQKIHQTYRLQYLKDVVLARILDDPTFSVLNSLIYFNQVDIVQQLQNDGPFLDDLFFIFLSDSSDARKRKEAVLFIQQCCAIAKNIQPPARSSLYSSFASHGLLQVIDFGLRHADVAVRIGATDIMISIIDHDPFMLRQTMYRQLQDGENGLLDCIIELLLVEVDLGVKSQLAEALKVLLDQGPPAQGPQEQFPKANSEFPPRPRQPGTVLDPQHEVFLTRFYERYASRLFRPLLDLENRTDMNFTVQQSSIFMYLVDVLSFLTRHHHRFSSFFVLNHNIVQRICQLLGSPEKALQLHAIRFVRHLIGLQDEFYLKHMTEKHALGPILELLAATLPRDNLVSSAALELFEYIRRENIKDLIKFAVLNYRPRFEQLCHIATFRDLLTRFDQTQGFTTNMEFFLESEDELGRRPPPSGRLMEHIVVDPIEEEYWNTSDPDEDDDDSPGHEYAAKSPMKNGSSTPSTPSRPLVDYPSDEDSDENVANDDKQGDTGTRAKTEAKTTEQQGQDRATPSPSPPLERLSEKRRREEDADEDELGKLLHRKRRHSGSSVDSGSAAASRVSPRRSFSGNPGGSTPRKISFSMSATPVKTGNGTSRSDDET